MEKEAEKSVKDVESKKEAVRESLSKKKPEAAPEAIYLAGELAANARKIFGTRPECVAAALKAAGKSACTVSEAKEIVERFLKREVQ